MFLNRLSLKDKTLFLEYLNLDKHYLGAYSFLNIYINKALYDIYWAIIKENLCIFFKDKTGAFLYLPPLGKKKDAQLIREIFAILNGFNKNKIISRIENVEEKDVSFYQKLGYDIKEKYPDYLYLREDLVNLKGNKFKSKRAGINYFIRHYKFRCLDFSLEYRNFCLSLYREWMDERRIKFNDKIYQGLLLDSFKMLKLLLNYPQLGFKGYSVEVDGKVKAFSLGYPLNEEVFCILYEITDLKIKGLSQFIFYYFSKNLLGYRYINALDDSGLDNLRRTKLSYHPIELVSNYIVKEKCI